MRKKYLLKLLVSFLKLTSVKLPDSILTIYCTLFGEIAFKVDKYGRDRVLKNLSIAFKDMEQNEKLEIARKFYGHLVMNIIEILKLNYMSKTEILRSVKIENESILKSEYEKGKGIILITAHLGNWEMLAARLAAGNYPLTVIGRDQEDKYLNELLISTREKLGIVNISKKPGVYKPIISALRNGEVIGLLADQNGGRSGIFVKFFDTPASTFKGPAYFTLRSGSSAIPIFCFRISFNSHIIEILPPIEISKDKGKKDFIFEFTQRYTSIIEQEIRKNPEQWLWLHDRWKTKLINSL